MMAKEDSLIQEIRERVKELSANTAPSQVRGTMDKLSPLLAKLDEVEFERLWADLNDRLSLKGRFYTALRRKIKEVRKEQKKSAPSKEATGLSPEEELKTLEPLAEPLTLCPDMLAAVVEALNRLGLAGQEKEAKIIYLALTSRIFERPVNVAVKGLSSGGKSFLVEQCLVLLPESAYYALSAMSEKALAYSQEPMAHRHLVIYEAAGLGGEFAQYLTRSLLSEGRIRYETVEKASEGLKARLIEREGPTGLIVTTTRAGLHPENETRILSIEVDDSTKQTVAVLLAYAKGENQETFDRKVDPTPFRALQRILELKQPQIVIPYAEPLALGCNPAAVRLRRDFPMVLNLVKAHTALHFHHRHKDEQGRVIATYDDYRAVYDLVADLVACGTGQKVTETVRETVGAVKALVGDCQDHPGFSIQSISDYLGLHKSTVSRRVKKALHAGYLENKAKAPAYKLVLGDQLPDNQTVLPPPDTINNISYPPETGATLQPHNQLSKKSVGYELQPSLQPPCNLQPASPGLDGCTPQIYPATTDATDNNMNLQGKKVMVAKLQGNQGGIDELKFSPNHLAALFKEGEEVEF
jgi:hypothetical protein